MTEELLQLKNIYKNFGNVKVLKDVNIKINKGEVVALIGDNGAGKSTLIKVITGVHRPTSGQVSFKGEEVVIKSVPGNYNKVLAELSKLGTNDNILGFRIMH